MLGQCCKFISPTRITFKLLLGIQVEKLFVCMLNKYDNAILKWGIFWLIQFHKALSLILLLRCDGSATLCRGGPLFYLLPWRGGDLKYRVNLSLHINNCPQRTVCAASSCWMLIFCRLGPLQLTEKRLYFKIVASTLIYELSTFAHYWSTEWDYIKIPGAARQSQNAKTTETVVYKTVEKICNKRVDFFYTLHFEQTWQPQIEICKRAIFGFIITYMKLGEIGKYDTIFAWTIAWVLCKMGGGWHVWLWGSAH